MKLMFIGYLHGYGGAEKMIIYLANAMKKKGHEVIFIALSENKSSYPLLSEIKYIFIEDRGENKVIILWNRYKNLRKEILKVNPELIVNFWFQSVYLCCLMGNKIYRKVIYSERGDPSDREYQGILKVIRMICFKLIKGFVFQSNAAKRYFNRKIQEKAVVISNPVFIDKNKIINITSDHHKIITVGRLHNQKNQKLLIEALKEILPKYKNLILEIYGEGELKEELNYIINKYNLGNHIFLKGTTTEIYQKIKEASIFVLTSNYEGIPNVLLEAMALGVPCISTDCKPGGVREIIKNMENGIIIPCNDVEALKESIIFLLENRNIANILGKNAEKIIELHSPKRIYQKWEKFFKSLI